jgi:lipoprotein-releasing system permease protein
VKIYNSETILKTLKSDARVQGVAPKLFTQVFFNEGSVEITGVIIGIDEQAESSLFHFDEYITSGKGSDISKVPNSIVLGKGLAEKLLVNIGDVLQITTSRGERFSLHVVGAFQSGLKEIDDSQSFASINTVQKLMGESGNYITEINIKLNKMETAPLLAREYESMFNVDAEEIQKANSQFETGSFVRTLISYTVGITLLIVAGFGIYNILNMMIYEKMDSIAILKATGFSGRDIKKIFLVIAISIGFFGGLAGLFFGYILSAIIDQIPFNTQALPTIKTYPINYNVMFYLIGAVFSLITTYFAGWFPSRKASKVDPVIIIRGK